MDWVTNYLKSNVNDQILQGFADLASIIAGNQPVVMMQTHLILAALFPIYIGSHAALSRPPSAAPAKPKASKASEDENDEIELQSTMEGLQLSDAIMFPVIASGALFALYVLIKWLNNPVLLNQILGYYFSFLGVFGVARLASDGFNVIASFVFPSVWSSRGTVYYVDPLLSQQVTGEAKAAETEIHRKFTEKTNPFPGPFSLIPFPAFITKPLWALRAALKSRWIFRGYLHGIFNVKTTIRLCDMTGFVIGVAAIVAYNVSGKEWYLTNAIGFGLCYGALQIISPTSFFIGSMVMIGLFVYDIVMVFYTPLMITVATTIDGPIKLVFPGPERGSMLGLGDVVLPGLVIALALRFDLFLHYLRKQTKAPGSTTTVIKAAYVEPTGKWGERFWTQRAKSTDTETVADGARFPKVYFNAAIIGYVVGMLATLYVLYIYNHGQPALLYLVPCVLSSLWGTAYYKGELELMWAYTEDGSMTEGEPKERGKGESESSVDSGDTVTPATIQADNLTGEVGVGKKDNVRNLKQHAHHVFLLSLSTPKQGKVPGVEIVSDEREE